MNEKAIATQDEKLMAGLAHGSILLPMWGLILSALIFITQREKSPFTREQAAQAIVWQAALIAVFMVGMGCYMLSFFGLMGGMILTGGEPAGGPPPAFFLPFGVMGMVALGALLFIAVGLFGAVRALQGHPFQYPLVGGFMNRYLAQE